MATLETRTPWPVARGSCSPSAQRADWHWHWALEQPAQSWHPCHLTSSPTEVRLPQFYVVGIAGPANHARLIFKCSEARILWRLCSQNVTRMRPVFSRAAARKGYVFSTGFVQHPAPRHRC